MAEQQDLIHQLTGVADQPTTAERWPAAAAGSATPQVGLHHSPIRLAPTWRSPTYMLV